MKAEETLLLVRATSSYYHGHTHVNLTNLNVLSIIISNYPVWRGCVCFLYRIVWSFSSTAACRKCSSSSRGLWKQKTLAESHPEIYCIFQFRKWIHLINLTDTTCITTFEVEQWRRTNTGFGVWSEFKFGLCVTFLGLWNRVSQNGWLKQQKLLVS